MSNNLHNPDFFSDGKRPSLEEMYRYLDQEMTPEEQHALEADLLDDPLFSEALEGLSEVKDRKKVAAMLAESETAFMKKLEANEEKEKKIISLPPLSWLAAAAVALLLVVFSFIYFEQKGAGNGNEVEIASGETVEKETTDKVTDKKVTPSNLAESTDPETNEISEKRNKEMVPREDIGDVEEPISLSLKDQPTPKVEQPPAMDVLAEEVSENEEISLRDVDLEDDFISATAVDHSMNRNAGGSMGGNAYFDTSQAAPSRRGVANFDDYELDHAPLEADEEEVQDGGLFRKNKSAKKEVASAPQLDETQSEPLSKSSTEISQPRIGNADVSYNQEVLTSKSITAGNDLNNAPKDHAQEGFSRYASHDFKGAAKSYQKAVSDNPENLQSRYYLGLSYLELDKEAKALEQFDFILKYEESSYYEDAEWYRAVALEKLNKREDAKQELESIKTRNGKYRSRAEQSLKKY